MAQRSSILTVLGKSLPPPKPMVSGRDTAQRKQHLGHNGRSPAWYHSYWRPLDSQKYPGQVMESCDLRRKLLEDNARILCMPCCEQDTDTPTEFGYNPTTYIKKPSAQQSPSFYEQPK
jgi:hypothetical protein